MLVQLNQRFGSTTQFLFTISGLLAVLIIVVGLWWWIPLQPRVTLKTTGYSCQRVSL